MSSITFFYMTIGIFTGAFLVFRYICAQYPAPRYMHVTLCLSGLIISGLIWKDLRWFFAFIILFAFFVATLVPLKNVREGREAIKSNMGLWLFVSTWGLSYLIHPSWFYGTPEEYQARLLFLLSFFVSGTFLLYFLIFQQHVDAEPSKTSLDKGHRFLYLGFALYGALALLRAMEPAHTSSDEARHLFEPLYTFLGYEYKDLSKVIMPVDVIETLRETFFILLGISLLFFVALRCVKPLHHLTTWLRSQHIQGFLIAIMGFVAIYMEISFLSQFQQNVFWFRWAPLGKVLTSIGYCVFGISKYVPRGISIGLNIAGAWVFYQILVLFYRRSLAAFASVCLLLFFINFDNFQYAYYDAGVVFFFILVSYFAIKAFQDDHDHNILKAFLWLGVGSLYKEGVVAFYFILVPFLAIEAVCQRSWRRLVQYIKYAFVALFLTLPWLCIRVSLQNPGMIFKVLPPMNVRNFLDADIMTRWSLWLWDTWPLLFTAFFMMGVVIGLFRLKESGHRYFLCWSIGIYLFLSSFSLSDEYVPWPRLGIWFYPAMLWFVITGIDKIIQLRCFGGILSKYRPSIAYAFLLSLCVLPGICVNHRAWHKMKNDVVFQDVYDNMFAYIKEDIPSGYQIYDGSGVSQAGERNPFFRFKYNLDRFFIWDYPLFESRGRASYEELESILQERYLDDLYGMLQKNGLAYALFCQNQLFHKMPGGDTNYEKYFYSYRVPQYLIENPDSRFHLIKAATSKMRTLYLWEVKNEALYQVDALLEKGQYQEAAMLLSKAYMQRRITEISYEQAHRGLKGRYDEYALEAYRKGYQAMMEERWLLAYQYFHDATLRGLDCRDEKDDVYDTMVGHGDCVSLDEFHQNKFEALQGHYPYKIGNFDITQVYCSRKATFQVGERIHVAFKLKRRHKTSKGKQDMMVYLDDIPVLRDTIMSSLFKSQDVLIMGSLRIPFVCAQKETWMLGLAFVSRQHAAEPEIVPLVPFQISPTAKSAQKADHESVLQGRMKSAMSNLIENGSFEHGMAGWTLHKNQVAYVVLSDDVAADGEYSLMVDFAGGIDRQYYQLKQGPIPVQPSTGYELSFYVKTSDVRSHDLPYIALYGNDGFQVQSERFEGTQAWHQKVYSFRTSETAQELKLSLIRLGKDDNTPWYDMVTESGTICGTLWLDHFQLKKKGSL